MSYFMATITLVSHAQTQILTNEAFKSQCQKIGITAEHSSEAQF